MNKTTISYKRHLAKTISYRIISTTIGFLVMWFATGNIKIGAVFGVAELVYKPLQYYIHERIWYKWIRYGIQIEKYKKISTIVPQIEKKEVESLVQITPTRKTLNYSSNR